MATPNLPLVSHSSIRNINRSLRFDDPYGDPTVGDVRRGDDEQEHSISMAQGMSDNDTTPFPTEQCVGIPVRQGALSGPTSITLDEPLGERRDMGDCLPGFCGFDPDLGETRNYLPGFSGFDPDLSFSLPLGVINSV